MFCCVQWMVEAIGYLFTEMKVYLYNNWYNIWYNASPEMMYYYRASTNLTVMVFVAAP